MKCCPFCNGSKEEITFYQEPSQADDRILCHVLCLKCGAMGPKQYNLDDAETAWDQRERVIHKIKKQYSKHTIVYCGARGNAQHSGVKNKRMETDDWGKVTCKRCQKLGNK